MESLPDEILLKILKIAVIAYKEPPMSEEKSQSEGQENQQMFSSSHDILIDIFSKISKRFERLVAERFGHITHITDSQLPW